MLRDIIQRECLLGSAIAPCLYAAAVRIIEDTGFWEPNRALNHQVSMFWQTRRPHSFGAIAAFSNEDGSLWQAKPQNPRPDKGKYEYPMGVGARAYLPPVPPEIRQRISQRYGVEVPLTGSFWDWLKSAKKIPIIPTEGAKKGLSLLSQGYVGLALLGVNAGVLKNEKIGGEKVRRLSPELVHGLAEFATAGRPFILAFDEDDKPKTRASVAAAQSDLAFWLSRNGSQVAIAQWSPEEGKGVDDLTVNQGPGRLEEVLSSAKTWQQWQIEQMIQNRLRRHPDLHIGADEFSLHVHQFPRSGLLALHGSKGTGKGKAIKELLKDRHWLSVTTLRSLARDQAAGWGGVFVNQSDRHGRTLLKDGEPCSGGVVCVPSLLKTQAIRAEVLVLDELPTIQSFLLSSNLANKNGIRPLLIEEIERRIRESELVICASADLSEAALRWVEDIRGERAYLVRSERQPLTYDVYVLEGKKSQAIAQFIEKVERLKPGNVAVFHTDSKGLADRVSAMLLDLGIQSLLITSSTSGGELESTFLESKGRDIPALIQSGVKAIITSPSVKEGFSIEHCLEQVDSVWGVFEGCSIGPEAVAQTCDRVRALIPRFIWMAERGRAYSKLSRAENPSTFLKEFKRSSSVLAKITRRSLLIETERMIGELDWESPSMQLLAHIGASHNRGMRAYRSHIEALLKAEGKIIHRLAAQVSAQAEKETDEALRAIKSKLEMERAIAIEAIQCPDEERVKALEQKDTLSPEELLELERFYLEQFYRTDMTRDDILWDAKGKLRAKVRHLESVLSPENAEAISAASINQTPTTPQDWKKDKLQQYVLEASGAAKLIRAIWSGSVVELTPELIAPIAAWLKHYARDVAIAFNFRNLEKVSDNQAVFTLLDWVGITRLSRRVRVKGSKHIPRIYSVDLENLEKLREVIERRTLADPPPPIEEVLERRDGSNLEASSELPANLAEVWAIAQTDKEQPTVLSAAAACMRGTYDTKNL